MKILFKLSKLLIIITILNVNMHCSNEEIINSNDQRNDSDTKLQNQKPVRTESQNRYDLQGRIAQRFDEKGNKEEN